MAYILIAIMALNKCATRTEIIRHAMQVVLRHKCDVTALIPVCSLRTNTQTG